MDKIDRVMSEICAPDSVLYSYKTGALTEAESKDVEKHLAECEACRARLKELPEKIVEQADEHVVEVPKKIRDMLSNMSIPRAEKKDTDPIPKRGDVWTARGDEYFWQQPKLVLVLNKVGEDRVYVVPINMLTFYATDLDVYVPLHDILYLAECANDGEIYTKQLGRKVDRVDSEYLQYIQDMILYIAGKEDIHVEDIPHGLPIINDDDQRIPWIIERTKSLGQLFAPARDSEE